MEFRRLSAAAVAKEAAPGRQAAGRFAELHACGIDFPAAVVSELELHGYAIERVYNRGRLIGVCACSAAEPPEALAAQPRRRRPWQHR